MRRGSRKKPGPKPGKTVVSKTIERTPRKTRQSVKKSDVAPKARGTSSCSSSTKNDEGSWPRVENVETVTIDSNVPEPIPVGITVSNNPSHDFATTIEIGSLQRKRKIEERVAAEAIAKIQEEEKKRAAQYEKELRELQERRTVSAQSSTATTSQNVSMQSAFPGPSSLSPPLPPNPPTKRFRQCAGEFEEYRGNNNTTTYINNNNIENSSVDKLAEALTTAIRKSSGGDDMRKFVARQAHPRELSTFSGDPEDWPSFISEFHGTNKECQFTDQENMIRLKNCLKGRALDSVKTMLIVPENLDHVLHTLKINFGRPELIISSLIQKVSTIPNPTEEQPESFLPFSNSVVNLVTTMQLLKETGHLLNPQLIRDLEAKLPTYARFNWALARKESGEQVGLLHFASWLQGFAETVSQVAAPKLYPEFKSNSRQMEKSRETVLAISDSASHHNHRSCGFCRVRGHDIENCAEFLQKSPDERWDWIKSNRFCFTCLRKNHQVKNCMFQRGPPRDRQVCGEDGCKGAHHRLLHKPNYRPAPKSSHIVANINEEPNSTTTALLKILPVRIRGPHGEIFAHAFLDDGSTTTLLDNSVAKKVGATGPKSTINLQWTSKQHHLKLKAEIVNVTIIGQDGAAHRLDEVKSIPGMNLPHQFVDVQRLRQRYSYLNQVEEKQMMQGVPQILIGQAHWDLIQTIDVIRGPTNAPVLSKTKLGWVLHGLVPHSSASTVIESVYSIWQGVEEDEKVHELVKSHFTTEDFGVRPVKKLPRSKSDEEAQKIMENTAKLLDTEQWEIGLLWKNQPPVLPPSKPMATNRLYSLENKLRRYPLAAKQYDTKIDENVAKGFCRKLTVEEAAIEPPNTWYHPHFYVENPNKPGKIRLVYDAAAKSNGKSFNDFIHLGPDLLRPLVSILLSFRQKEVAFGGDIREMFPQIKIRKEDCCSQRFLWRNMDQNRPPDVYEFSSMMFGAADSPCKSQYIKNQNALQYENEFPDAVLTIIMRIYMDDLYNSTHTEEEAIKIILEIIEIFRRGGFTMCNWVSNSKTVLAAIPLHLRANPDTNLEISSLPAERVLGMNWNPNSDTFTFLLQFHRVPKDVVDGARRPTKREILKLVMAIFDPLGLISHFTVRAKILLQDIWRAGTGWDDQVSNEIFLKWVEWLRELQEIPKISIPRCYGTNMAQVSNIQLHVFCDASEKAFAAAAFFRIESSEGQVETSLVMGKTRVAPLRPLTIPRLELQAAVMGTRLAHTIISEHDLQFSSVFFWSDSQTVIKWIKSDARKYNAFVSHRIGEILESTDVQSWRWIPSEDNVADDATRDERDTDLSQSSRWFHGPPFLTQPKENWPDENSRIRENLDEEDLELKAEFICSITTTDNPSLPDPQRFSSWSRLVRATAWVVRVANKRKNKDKKYTLHLSHEELEEAEKLWWKQIQSEEYPQEISRLQDQKPIPSTSRILALKPGLGQDGILRSQARTQNSNNLNFETKNPIVLDPHHTVTKLLMQHYHLKVNHHGQEQAVNEIRQKFCIPAIRSAVRSAWNSCLTCKHRRSRPEPPEMAPLPEFRVNRPARPFSYTGIDFFGPLEVKVKRTKEVRYGLIFVCLSTRAIHLEITDSLSTEATLLALQRFILLRAPEKIFSDNFSSFRRASKDLKKALLLLDHDKIKEKLAMWQIEWSFIPPAAPHFGGAWESLIKSVKAALTAILKGQVPREEVLRTAFAEAQATVNGHPLTHVPVDPADPESLTPNHFLIGSSSGNVPRILVNPNADLSRQWKHAQSLANSFWKRWIREYLPSLTRRSKWHKTTRLAKVGDLVLIADDNQPRNIWPRGIITATFPGKDGIVRVVNIKTNFGEYRRPLSKICMLDVHQE